MTLCHCCNVVQCLIAAQWLREGHWRLLLENALVLGNVGSERTHMVTSTQHRRASFNEPVFAILPKFKLGGRIT